MPQTAGLEEKEKSEEESIPSIEDIQESLDKNKKIISKGQKFHWKTQVRVEIIGVLISACSSIGVLAMQAGIQAFLATIIANIGTLTAALNSAMTKRNEYKDLVNECNVKVLVIESDLANYGLFSEKKKRTIRKLLTKQILNLSHYISIFTNKKQSSTPRNLTADELRRGEFQELDTG